MILRTKSLSTPERYQNVTDLDLPVKWAIRFGSELLDGSIWLGLLSKYQDRMSAIMDAFWHDLHVYEKMGKAC